VNFTIYHTKQQNLKQEDFHRIVESLMQRYGFFVSVFNEYAAAGDAERAGGRLGSMAIEVNHVLIALALAQEIRTRVVLDGTFDPNMTVTMTQTAMRGNLDKRLTRRLPGPPPPRVSMLESVHFIPEAEIAAIHELVALRGSGQWKFDDRYRVLVVPGDDEESLRENIARMKRNDGDKFCLFVCDEESAEDLVPEAIFVYKRDGTVVERPFCRRCLILTIQEFVAFFNPNTRVINQEMLIGLMNGVEPLPVEPSDDEAGDERWPVVPLGALIWALMSDKHTLGPLVKAWVSGVQEYTVRKAKHLIAYCPDHPARLLQPPGPGLSLKCDLCNFMLCGMCGTWHKMEQACDLAEIEGTKRCPRCKVPVCKISGCDRVTCRCGVSFCWKCPKEKRVAYATANECYAHLAAVHGGYYD
jgi:hypothetical protein